MNENVQAKKENCSGLFSLKKSFFTYRDFNFLFHVASWHEIFYSNRIERISHEICRLQFS